MLLKFLSALFVFASCFFTNALHANEEASSIDIEALDWQGPGIYSLSQSHARVSIPEDCIAVFDQDAKKLHGVENPDNIVNLEALMYDKEATDTIIFEFFEEGYVAMDDWDNIDSKELLASIRENTEEANRKLAGTGIPSVHVRSWLREPLTVRPTPSTGPSML